MNSIDIAIDYCLSEIRAGRLCTDVDLSRKFGLTLYAGESCRKMAEDVAWANSPVAKPAQKTKPNSTTGMATNYKNSPAYKQAMDRERQAGFARSLPRQER